MLNRFMVLILLLAVLAAFPFSGLTQAPAARNQKATEQAASQPSIPPPAGWKRCPRCQNNQDRREAAAKYRVEGHAFDPHNLSGVWGYDGARFGQGQESLLTDWAKQQIKARGGESP